MACLAALLADAALCAGDADERAEAALTALHGYVRRDEKAAGRPVIGVIFGGDVQLTDADVKAIGVFKELRWASIAGPLLTDETLKVLSGCSRLERLQVENRPLLTDAGLEHLAALPSFASWSWRAARKSPTRG